MVYFWWYKITVVVVVAVAVAVAVVVVIAFTLFLPDWNVFHSLSDPFYLLPRYRVITPEIQLVRTSYSLVELPSIGSWFSFLWQTKLDMGDCTLFAGAAAVNCHHLRRAQDEFLLYHSSELKLSFRLVHGEGVFLTGKHKFWANCDVGPTIAICFLYVLTASSSISIQLSTSSRRKETQFGNDVYHPSDIRDGL